MKAFELIAILMLGSLIGYAAFVGLKLDDNAQQIKESQWQKFEEVYRAK